MSALALDYQYKTEALVWTSPFIRRPLFSFDGFQHPRAATAANLLLPAIYMIKPTTNKATKGCSAVVSLPFYTHTYRKIHKKKGKEFIIIMASERLAF